MGYTDEQINIIATSLAKAALENVTFLDVLEQDDSLQEADAEKVLNLVRKHGTELVI